MNLDDYCFGIVQVSEASTGLDWISRQRWALEDWVPAWCSLSPPEVSSRDGGVGGVPVPTLQPTLHMSHRREQSLCASG